ncbi:hypothetical protein VSU19_06660 [Verrucomicrobiales bacterium BCK34]|nr:hypothetical protein [Verrucomicrobiales bacterium BCK34]
MSRVYSVIVLVLLSTFRADLVGEDIEVPQPISLRAMIASGQVRVAGSDPEKDERLIKTLKRRERVREIEVKIFRRTEALLSQIKRRAYFQDANRIVRIESIDGKISATGTLIDPGKGVAVTSLDGPCSGLGVVRVIPPNGREYTATLRPLSEGHHLAVLDPGDDFEGFAEDCAAASEISSDRSASLVPGGFIGAEIREGEWVLGSVTSLHHSDENGIEPIVRDSVRAHWERSGIPVSVRRTGFEGGVVCDLPIAAEDCGGPLYTSHAGFVGVVVSRTDRHEAILIPVQLIENLLDSMP